MAGVLLDISVLGKGTVRFASGSQYILSQSSDWKRTSGGTYNNAYDLKFFMNGNLIQTGIGPTNNSTIQSSSIDRSFTILSTATTASIKIIFEPEDQNDGIIPKKSSISPSIYANVPVDYFMSNPTLMGTIQSGRSIATQKDYDRGYMFRYLYRQVNNENDLVKEVTEGQYQSVSSFYLYKAIKIKWKIIGNKEKAASMNTTITEQAEVELKGSKSLLMRNTLLYWKDLPDVVEEFDVTQKVIQTGGS